MPRDSRLSSDTSLEGLGLGVATLATWSPAILPVDRKRKQPEPSSGDDSLHEHFDRLGRAGRGRCGGSSSAKLDSSRSMLLLLGLSKRDNEARYPPTAMQITCLGTTAEARGGITLHCESLKPINTSHKS